MKSQRLAAALILFIFTFSALACGSQVIATPTATPTATPISMTTYTDETGVITVSLPSKWSYVSKTSSYENSVRIPQIIASTDKAKFDEFSAPGIAIGVSKAVSMTSDEAITLFKNKVSSLLFNAACKQFYDHTYYDRVYDGFLQKYSNCNSFDNHFIVLIAKLAKTDVIVYVMFNSELFQNSSKADDMFEAILATLKVDASLLP